MEKIRLCFNGLEWSKTRMDYIYNSKSSLFYFKRSFITWFFIFFLIFLILLGDILLCESEHVVLFGGWVNLGKSYIAYEETRPGILIKKK